MAEIKQQTNKDGSGAGQMAAWKVSRPYVSLATPSIIGRLYGPTSHHPPLGRRVVRRVTRAGPVQLLKHPLIAAPIIRRSA
jgi:hypothetical protein